MLQAQHRSTSPASLSLFGVVCVMLKKLTHIFVLVWLIANRIIVSVTIDCDSHCQTSGNPSSICIQDNNFQVETSGKTPPRPLLPNKQKAIDWFVDQDSRIRLNLTWMQNKFHIPEGYHIQIWHEELAIMYRFNIYIKVNITQIGGDSLSDVTYFNYNCFGSSIIWEIVTQFSPPKKNRKYYQARIYSLPMYAEGNDDLYLKVNISMPNCCKKAFKHSSNCKDKLKKFCSNRRKKKQRHKHMKVDDNTKSKTEHTEENHKSLKKYETVEVDEFCVVIIVTMVTSITVVICFYTVLLYLKCYYKGRHSPEDRGPILFVMNHLSADIDMYNEAEKIVADLQKHVSLIAICSWQLKEAIAAHGLHQWLLNTECDGIVLLCFGNYSNNVFRTCIENVLQCNKVIVCCTAKDHNCVETKYKYQKVSQQQLKQSLSNLVEKNN